MAPNCLTTYVPAYALYLVEHVTIPQKPALTVGKIDQSELRPQIV